DIVELPSGKAYSMMYFLEKPTDPDSGRLLVRLLVNTPDGGRALDLNAPPDQSAAASIAVVTMAQRALKAIRENREANAALARQRDSATAALDLVIHAVPPGDQPLSDVQITPDNPATGRDGSTEATITVLQQMAIRALEQLKEQIRRARLAEADLIIQRQLE